MTCETASRVCLIHLAFLLTIGVHQCLSFKVLLLPLFQNSHVFSLTAIGEEMAKRGHVMHMLIPHEFPLSSELTSNQSAIKVILYGSTNNSNAMDYNDMFETVARQAIDYSGDLAKLLESVKDNVDKEARRLLIGNDEMFDEMSKTKYDLALVDSIFFAKYLNLIPHRLGIPWVTYTDVVNPWLVRVPWLPSFHCIRMLPYHGKMTFFQRLQNAIASVIFFNYPALPDAPNEILDTYRNYGPFNSLDDLTARSLLFVVTSDVVLDEALPMTPNMISAGGLTVKPVKPNSLPDEYETFIQAAKSGFIVVSFGSMASDIPATVARKFIHAFDRLQNIHFIWRFQNTEKLSLPKNIMISKWLPQNQILADSRVRLFITHCGNNGQFESVYHGVPMIGFPLFGDQQRNAKRLEFRGYGLSMDINQFDSDELLENIKKILSDSNYKKRVNLASQILRSNPRSPAERVADGMEHVIQFGADHLLPTGNDLNIVEYLMLDLLVFIVVVMLIVCILIWRFIRFLIRKFSGRSSKRKSD